MDNWPHGLTRDAFFGRLKQFQAETGRHPRYIALTAEEWAEVKRWGGGSERPTEICGAVVLGLDSPVFYLA
jgi:hypothetical protein